MKLKQFFFNDQSNGPFISNFAIIFMCFFILFCVLGGMWGCPRYSVYQRELAGKAEYAQAVQNRKIKIEEANANKEAEKLNAEAEVIRAQGAHDAIEIENGALTPLYLQYLWVRQQTGLSDKTVIYIPTSQCGIPDFNPYNSNGQYKQNSLPIQESTRLVGK